MDLQEALYHARVGGAVAFFGAGFSAGATNAAGKQIPSSQSLRDLLAAELGLPEQDELALIADMYVSERGQTALNLKLVEQFTATIVTDTQIQIMSYPWRRIYSTNYDGPGHRAHIRHHAVTDWVAEHAPEWVQIDFIRNRYPYDRQRPAETSFADFYHFGRR